MKNLSMHQDSSSRDDQPRPDGLLDPIGRLWLGFLGLGFILASLVIKEVNTLTFLTGSIFAFLSFNGARVSSITLGKDKVGAEMKIPERIAELSNKNVTRIAVVDSDAIPSSLFSELTKPFNTGIQTEGYGLAQLINADEQAKAKVLRNMSISSGVPGILEQSIVGIGRVQEPESSNKLFALMNDGTNYILECPETLAEAIGNASGPSGDIVAVYPRSLSGVIQDGREN